MNWEVFYQVGAILGTAVFYGGRLVARIESVERTVIRMEKRVDELVDRDSREPLVLVPSTRAGQDDSPRGKARA
jgi:hypothetical protein